MDDDNDVMIKIIVYIITRPKDKSDFLKKKVKCKENFWRWGTFLLSETYKANYTKLEKRNKSCKPKWFFQKKKSNEILLIKEQDINYN